MGSKKHKKNKSERRDRSEDYVQNPSLKLILKVGSNSTPEYSTDSPAGHGMCENSGGSNYDHGSERERSKKSKKKKKKKDREKRHKHHHKEKRHRHRQEYSAEVLSPAAVDSSTMHQFSPGGSETDLKSMGFLAAKPVTRPMVPLLISPKSVLSGNESDSQPLLSPTSSTGGGGFGGGRSSLEKAGSESGREPRTCVLKMKASKTPLGKVLEHLLRSLEKRDPQQYFAWPVTDDIAPGYSTIITRAMDFSTIRQKIEENQYSTLPDFASDFRLMCDNAMLYNQSETVYHKAAKKLLQVGNKMLQPGNLIRSLKSMTNYLRSLGEAELGFDLAVAAGEQKDHQESMAGHLDSADDEYEATGQIATAAGQTTDNNTIAVATGESAVDESNKAVAEIVDQPPKPERTEEEEILLQVQRASEKLARERQLRRKRIAKIGFLRQNKDGTTSMQILVDVDGVCGPEKFISLGDFTGKLKSGTGSLNSAREDARNVARLVKPIDYGAFASFAPVFDSRFANLTKEETQLVQNTYGGDETATEYVESVLNFTKHSEYASQMANGILDVLTKGEHSKVMGELMAVHQPRYEEREVERVVPIVEKEKSLYGDVKVDFAGLRSLSGLGIDTSFIDEWIQVEKCAELQHKLAAQLSANAVVLDQLNTVQCDRLSQPLPHHLQMVQKPRVEEVELAHQITSNLVDMAKNLTPEAIANAPAIRKAMGVSCGNLEGFAPKLNVYNLNGLKFGGTSAASSDYDTSEPMDIETEALVSQQEDRGMDLDQELRQFLEAGAGQ